MMETRSKHTFFLIFWGVYLMFKTGDSSRARVETLCTHFVRVQVRVLLTQAEQERFWVPTQRLFGRDEVGPTDVESNPARARLVHRFGRGARVALHREPEHRASAAAARHPAGTELAAPRRNHESGRSQAHGAPDVAVLGLLYGASTARFHNMQFSHVFLPSVKHTQPHD